MTGLDGCEGKQNRTFAWLRPAKAMPARVTGRRIDGDQGVISRASDSRSTRGVSDGRGQWNNAED